MLEHLPRKSTASVESLTIAYSTTVEVKSAISHIDLSSIKEFRDLMVRHYEFKVLIEEKSRAKLNYRAQRQNQALHMDNEVRMAFARAGMQKPTRNGAFKFRAEIIDELQKSTQLSRPILDESNQAQVPQLKKRNLKENVLLGEDYAFVEPDKRADTELLFARKKTLRGRTVEEKQSGTDMKNTTESRPAKLTLNEVFHINVDFYKTSYGEEKVNTREWFPEQLHPPRKHLSRPQLQTDTPLKTNMHVASLKYQRPYEHPAVISAFRDTKTKLRESHSAAHLRSKKRFFTSAEQHNNIDGRIVTEYTENGSYGKASPLQHSKGSIRNLLSRPIETCPTEMDQDDANYGFGLEVTGNRLGKQTLELDSPPLTTREDIVDNSTRHHADSQAIGSPAQTQHSTFDFVTKIAPVEMAIGDLACLELAAPWAGKKDRYEAQSTQHATEHGAYKPCCRAISSGFTHT